ncbi:MAG TPA: hypothetical protein VG323_01925, partial [Thermoanaerobaculia bacterium]|nr:hypothetical protein [Thermoanaerobaculia bacterium]
VYEALSLGIPFLAARSGGIPELIDEADREHVLFEPSAEALRNALHDGIERGGWIARPAETQEASRRSWAAMHAHWRTFLPEERETRSGHGLTAVVDHRPGAPLHLTLNSLCQCPSLRRFIVLNRGGETLPLKNLDLLTEDPSALDGELAAIDDDAVLLIHAGVAVVPEAMEAMLRALASADVDGLIPAARLEASVVPPLGGSAAFSLFEGATFTGAMLVRRDALFAAKEGRAYAADAPFLGLADFCVARSERIWPYPEVVAELSAPIDAKSSLPARVAAYGDAPAAARYYMLAAGYGAANHERPVSFKRELVLRALDRGLSPLIRIGSWGARRLRRWLK